MGFPQDRCARGGESWPPTRPPAPTPSSTCTWPPATRCSYGASHPEALVARAAEHGQRLLALTDRDGVYGAVKFAKACLAAGITPGARRRPRGRPPVARASRRSRRGQRRAGARPRPAAGRTSTRGTHGWSLLARGRAGWAALNRLVSATHLGGERGRPVSTLDLVAEHAAGGHLLVLLGPASELGRALAGRRPDLATAVLDAWRQRIDNSQLIVEVVSHRGPVDATDPAALSTPQAARMLGFARDAGLGAVLTNAVRYAEPDAAVTADVLDAARRLVALDLRHVDRPNAEGHLKSGAQMARGRRRRGPGRRRSGRTSEPAAVRRLLETTAARGDGVRPRPVRRPRPGRGASSPSWPSSTGSGRPGARAVLRERCEAGLARRYGSAPDPAVRRAARRRARRHRAAGLRRLLPHRRRGRRPDPRDGGAGGRPRLGRRQPGQLPARHLRRRPDRATACSWSGSSPRCARRCPTSTSTSSRPAAPRSTSGSSTASAASAASCVSMMDTYRVRHAVRDVGAALGLPPGEIDALAKAFPHIRARDARAALPSCPSCGPAGSGAGRRRGAGRAVLALVERLDGLPRHVALHPCGVLLSDAHPARPHPGRGELAGLPDEPVRQGRRRGPRPAQARRPRHPDAVVDGARGRRDRAGRRRARSTSTPSPLDDAATFELIRSAHTLGCFQIESPGQRELVGKFGPGDLRRPHHRHLAVPARPGEVRHGHAVPARPAGLGAAAVPAPRPASRRWPRPAASWSSTSRCCRSSR